MQSISRILYEQNEQLEEVSREASRRILEAPEGKLRICGRKGSKPSYYYVGEEQGSYGAQGRYMHQDEESLARKLAQRDYDRRVLQEAQKQSDCIRRFLKNYDDSAVKGVYEGLNSYRQQLVKPIDISDESFAGQWKQKEYVRPTIPKRKTPILTEKGEEVRNADEKLLADFFDEWEIPYRYGAPLFLKDGNILRPSFTLLNTRTRREIYWDHLIFTENPESREDGLRRIEVYTANHLWPGIHLIVTSAERSRPLPISMVRAYVQELLI